MRIMCVDPDSTVDYPRTIADTGQSCPHGHTIDVDDKVAGKPPKGEPGAKGYHPGEGLLAQTDVWAVGKPSKNDDKETSQ